MISRPYQDPIAFGSLLTVTVKKTLILFLLLTMLPAATVGCDASAWDKFSSSPNTLKLVRNFLTGTLSESAYFIGDYLTKELFYLFTRFLFKHVLARTRDFSWTSVPRLTGILKILETATMQLKVSSKTSHWPLSCFFIWLLYAMRMPPDYGEVEYPPLRVLEGFTWFDLNPAHNHRCESSPDGCHVAKELDQIKHTDTYVHVHNFLVMLRAWYYPSNAAPAWSHTNNYEVTNSI